MASRSIRKSIVRSVRRINDISTVNRASTLNPSRMGISIIIEDELAKETEPINENEEMEEMRKSCWQRNKKFIIKLLISLFILLALISGLVGYGYYVTEYETFSNSTMTQNSTLMTQN